MTEDIGLLQQVGVVPEEINKQIARLTDELAQARAALAEAEERHDLEMTDALDHSDDEFHRAMTAAGVPLSLRGIEGACDGSLLRLRHLIDERDRIRAALARAVEALRELTRAVIEHGNESGVSGDLGARLSDARAALAAWEGK